MIYDIIFLSLIPPVDKITLEVLGEAYNKKNYLYFQMPNCDIELVVDTDWERDSMNMGV